MPRKALSQDSFLLIPAFRVIDPLWHIDFRTLHSSASRLYGINCRGLTWARESSWSLGASMACFSPSCDVCPCCSCESLYTPDPGPPSSTRTVSAVYIPQTWLFYQVFSEIIPIRSPARRLAGYDSNPTSTVSKDHVTNLCADVEQLLQQGTSHLEKAVQELRPDIAQPDKLREILLQIFECFKVLRKEKIDKSIEPHHLFNCAKLLATFQALTDKHMEDLEEKEFHASDSVDLAMQIEKSNSKEELTIQKTATRKLSEVVAYGMLLIAKKAVATSTSDTSGLVLADVLNFEDMLGACKVLVKQVFSGMTARPQPDEDPAAHLERSEDPVYLLAGGSALLNLEDCDSDLPLEIQGGHSWTGIY
ncbi:hypothetical protein JX266_014311 [Neoarthrinium moseri]|nr:hypothetical protein JX266_014311 [Neoarthrinium moseri]